MTPENQKLDELMESWNVPEPPRWLEDRIWRQVREEINPADPSPFPRLIRRWLLRPLRISVVAGILCIGAISSVLFSRRPEATRVTSDLGLTTDPSISLDRGTLAYSSDRGGQGHLGIWIEPIGCSRPIRLTNGEVDDHSPSISQEWVVFRSERHGAGIYRIPVTGGPQELVAANGRGPRISPDGHWIAYWTGDDFAEPGAVFIVPLLGGLPVNICPQCAFAKFPVWSPDSHNLLFRAALKLADSQVGNTDWFVVRIDSGRPASSPIRTMARNVLQHEAIRFNTVMPIPEVWHNNEVFFTTRVSPSNAFTLRLDRDTFVATDSPIRLTFGTGEITQIAVTHDGMMYFSSLLSSTNIFAIPMDFNTASPLGPLVGLTAENATNIYPSLSADGTKLTFSSDRRSERGIWLRDLATGEYRFLCPSSSRFDSPKLSPDGSFVAYTTPDQTEHHWTLKMVPTEGSHEPITLSDAGNAGAPKGWSKDGSMLLFETKSTDPEKRFGVGIFNVKTRKICRFEHPVLAVFPNSFSPDSQFIAFHTRDRSGHRSLWIAKWNGGCWPDENAWIPAVSEPSGSDREAQWSPDGYTLYFLSERDGIRCIWAQRLDPQSHRPIGRPFAVQHFHTASASLLNEDGPGAVGLTVMNNKLIVSVKTTTGNIWKMPPTDTGFLRIFHVPYVH